MTVYKWRVSAYIPLAECIHMYTCTCKGCWGMQYSCVQEEEKTGFMSFESALITFLYKFILLGQKTIASLSKENNSNNNICNFTSIDYIPGTGLYAHCPIFVLE